MDGPCPARVGMHGRHRRVDASIDRTRQPAMPGRPLHRPGAQQLDKDDIEQAGNHGRGACTRIQCLIENEAAAQLQPLERPFSQTLQDQHGWKHGQQALRQHSVKTEVSAQPGGIPTPKRQALPIELLLREIREEIGRSAWLKIYNLSCALFYELSCASGG